MFFLFHHLTLNACDTDSPGVPPSAGAHQLFRGFSFIASTLLEEEGLVEPVQPPPHPVVQVRHSGSSSSRTQMNTLMSCLGINMTEETAKRHGWVQTK